MTNCLVTIYLLTACVFFFRWIKCFLKDTRMSYQQKYTSIPVLLIATALWPVVAPVSYLELLTNKDREDSIAKYSSVKTAQIVF